MLFTCCFTLSNSYSNESKLDAIDTFDGLNTSSESGGGYVMNAAAEYSWIEINETGVVMSMISDSVWDIESIFFDSWRFRFYETDYDSISVSSGGWMTFPSPNTISYSGIIPDLGDQNNDLVALLWDRFQPSENQGGGGTIYYQFLINPNRLVIEYKDMYTENYDSDSKYAGSFEVIFYDTGNIKFQYQKICNLTNNPAVIGLDHGDLVNYNVFDEFTLNSLPVSNRAIEFSFNEMIPIEYSLEPEINQELTWIVEYSNDEKMQLIFGPNWEDSFGLPENPKRGEKTKINVTQNGIGENLVLSYEIWDWTYRLDEFSHMASSSDSLLYPSDPTLNATEYLLPNFFPLIAPTPLFLYLRESNLSSFYSQYYIITSNMETRVSFYESREVNGHYLNTQGTGIYDSRGILTSLEFSTYNQSAGEYEMILQLSEVSPEHLLEFSIDVKENEEHAWLVTQANDEKMSAVLGSEWESLFGFSSKPKRAYKMNTRINTLTNTTSHYTIDYSVGNWTERNDEFSSTFPFSESLEYAIDPFDYNYPFIPKNLFPLFIPSPPEHYLRFANLDHDFSLAGDPFFGGYEPILYYSIYEDFNGNHINFHGHATYSPNGVLNKIDFDLHNNSVTEKVFEMVYLTPELLLNGSFSINPNEEKTWLVANVNDTLMEEFFGNNWEDTFGLASNVNNLDKTKIVANSITEDASEIHLNYDLWGWTNLFENFTDETIISDEISFRKDPFSYEDTHALPNLFPFLIPYPIDLYFNYGNLDPEIYQYIQELPFFGDTKIQFSMNKPNTYKNLWGTVVYNKEGILSEMNFEVSDYSSMNPYAVNAFSLIEIHEGEKPDYVPVELNESYEYGIYYFEGIYPGGDSIPSYERVKMDIQYISAEDPIRNRTIVYSNTTFLDENGAWIKVSKDELYFWSSFIPFLDVNFVLQDLGDYFYNPTRGFPRFVSNDINWTAFVEDLYKYIALEPYYPQTEIEELENGFKITQDYYGDDTYQSFLYTDKGVLNISSLGVNGEEFFTCRLNDFNYGEETSINATLDIDPSVLNLNSEGKWITACIELPEDYDVNNINLESILLNDLIHAEIQLTTISDFDNDNIPDLMVKFERSSVKNILEPGENVEIVVSGQLNDGVKFIGIDTIRVINPTLSFLSVPVVCLMIPIIFNKTTRKNKLLLI